MKAYEILRLTVKHLQICDENWLSHQRIASKIFKFADNRCSSPKTHFCLDADEHPSTLCFIGMDAVMVIKSAKC